ncbi:fatty acid desaturase [Pseudaestuariivita sp.]|uniref:fatty acid desaturase n=1 Tax=Pseudaestuariivita sp. TaxID=2211669 RepID=UPI0040590C57
MSVTHTEVLKALPAELRARLQTRSDARGLWHLAGHLGALLLTGRWIALGLALWPIALILHGILLVFLFTLQHECTHETPFATPWLNRWAGHAAGFMIFQPFTWFRYFHLAHHRHTNDPAHDPELTEGAEPETWRTYLWHVSGLPTWWAALRGLVQMAIAPRPAPYLPERVLPRIKREARINIALYLVLFASFFWTSALFWLWLIPLMLGQPFLRLYLLAEHGRCPPVANMLENTRTTFTTRVVLWVAWNMPYHIEHHSAPSVPFHHLPELHRHMAPPLVTTSNGYSVFTKDYTAKLM